MNEHVLSKAVENLITGKYIGGGVTGKFERMSLGIFVSALLLIGPIFLKYGAISVGIFWCYKRIFKQLMDLMKICSWQKMPILLND